jgi:hydroxypyruvate reductase
MADMRGGQREELMRAVFAQVVAAAQPRACMEQHLPSPPHGRTMVIGAGKASAAMASAFEELWQGPVDGLVLTRHGHGMPTRFIEVVEAGHPVPDEAGLVATRDLMQRIGAMGPDDLVVGLFSGGGSSLLCAPAPGLTLADKQNVNRALLRSGAPIDAMNVVRKHLSRLKGGRMPLLCPQTRFVSLIMSDVPGDDLSTVASGPTVGDASTLADARAAVERWSIALPPAALAALSDSANETPKPADPRLSLVDNRLVLSPDMALRSAIPLLTERGYEVDYLGDAIEGDAARIGAIHAQLARAARRQGRRVAILSGGETTVTVQGPAGKGGRDSEYLLGFALALGNDESSGDIVALAADSDGIDGSEDNAGAVRLPDTLERARAAGLDPEVALREHDAYSVFAASGDLVVTGPTHTNVNDVRVILVR